MINSTFADNSATGSNGKGAALWVESAGLYSVYNTIMWDNESPAGEQIYFEGHTYGFGDGELIVDHSNIEGGENDGIDVVAGTLAWVNSLDEDPLFVSASAGDYSLGIRSPSLNAGKTELLPQDEYDLNENSCTIEGIPYDLAFEKRIVRGCVDQGAFEEQDWCISDLTCSDDVGVPDLLVMINSWGDCEECSSNPDDWGCPPDLNGDGTVGVPDLLILINDWGPCPESAQGPPQDIQDCLDQYDIDQDEGALLDCLDAALEE